MKRYAIVTCLVFAMSLTLVSCRKEQNSTVAYQQKEEQSILTETEKPTGYEGSNQDSSDEETKEQEISGNDNEAKESKLPQVASEEDTKEHTDKQQDSIKTESPTVTNKPQATKSPVATEKPEATKIPAVTKKPEATKKPAATKKPQATIAPTVEPIVKPTAKPTAKPTTKPTTKPTIKPDNSSGVNTAAYIAEVLNLINEERAKEGLSPLTTTTKLKQAANKRAEETVTLFSHTRPDGSSGVSVLKEYGISYRAWGENIAYGQKSPAAVMNAWMNSSGHRANILSSKFGKVGIGCYVHKGVLYWTQVFTD